MLSRFFPAGHQDVIAWHFYHESCIQSAVPLLKNAVRLPECRQPYGTSVGDNGEGVLDRERSRRPVNPATINGTPEKYTGKPMPTRSVLGTMVPGIFSRDATRSQSPSTEAISS